jgi:SAM-dependent methyltransferase
LGADFPLVHAPAESVPLPDASFDIVFSDHAALSWGDPQRVVPEVARLLRPGGLLVFNVTSPFARMCLDEEADRQVETLLLPYFRLHIIDEGDGAATYNLGYGEWIRLLHANALVVEDLVEPQPPEGATTTYGIPVAWAERWPAECIWVCRKT